MQHATVTSGKPHAVRDPVALAAEHVLLALAHDAGALLSTLRQRLVASGSQLFGIGLELRNGRLHDQVLAHHHWSVSSFWSSMLHTTFQHSVEPFYATQNSLFCCSTSVVLLQQQTEAHHDVAQIEHHLLRTASEHQIDAVVADLKGQHTTIIELLQTMADLIVQLGDPSQFAVVQTLG